MSLSIGTQIEMVEIWLRDGDPLDLIDDGTSMSPRAVLEEIHKSLRWLMQLLAEVPAEGCNITPPESGSEVQQSDGAGSAT